MIMRPEIKVILICVLLAVLEAVVVYACLIAAGDADRRAEEAEKELEKEKQKREPRIVMLEGECVVRTLQPDSEEMEKKNEHQN